MVDHVQDRALHPDVVERDEAEHAEAQVGDGAVGDELLDVLLDPRDQRAINDADDAEHPDSLNDCLEDVGVTVSDQADRDCQAQ